MHELRPTPIGIWYCRAPNIAVTQTSRDGGKDQLLPDSRREIDAQLQGKVLLSTRLVTGLPPAAASGLGVPDAAESIASLTGGWGSRSQAVRTHTSSYDPETIPGKRHVIRRRVEVPRALPGATVGAASAALHWCVRAQSM